MRLLTLWNGSRVNVPPQSWPEFRNVIRLQKFIIPEFLNENTLFPLSIAFINDNGHIIRAEDMEPQST